MARNAGLQVRATKCNNCYLIGNCRRGRLGPDGNKKTGNLKQEKKPFGARSVWKSDLDWAERPKNKEAGNLPSTVVKLEANIKNHINEKKQNNNNEKSIRRNRKWRKPNPLSTKKHKSSLNIAYIWKPTLSGFTTSQKNFLVSLLGVFCDSKLATIPRDNCVLISWLRGNVVVH